MPPKRSRSTSQDSESDLTLNQVEKLLLPIAARLFVALRCKEANPGDDSSHFLGKVKEEMVCRIHASYS